MKPSGLKLSQPLSAGKKYTITFPEGMLSSPEISFKYDPSVIRSEAVHVNQVGYRPDDPVKLAFLSETRFKNSDAPFYTSPMGPNGDAEGEAGWTYLRTIHPGVDKEMHKNIYNAMVRDADKMVSNCENSDFHWAGGPCREITWGALSMPESQLLCRAHFLTGNEKYLKAIVMSTLSGAGANPVNMCYVTGVGSRWPQHPLHEDAYITHQALYEGITVGGPTDPKMPNKQPNYRRIAPRLYPASTEWPATEAYFDVWIYAPMNEYTVHQTMLPTSFVWGYLVAR